MTFELYDNHAPNSTHTWAGYLSGPKSIVGTSMSKALPGYGVHGGALAGTDRAPDEDLTLRHHKRGLLSLVNNGDNSNGSEFLVTFCEAPYLNGYNQVIGELVGGDDVLGQIEADSNRCGALGSSWTISGAGHA